MKEKNEIHTECGCGFGCGCVSALLEICAFVLVCNICGCDWANRAVRHAVNYVKEVCK